MANASFKNPPSLTNSTQYEKWVKEVKLWTICCKLEKKEQGPAIALSLSGTARDAVLEMDIEVLNSDEGVTKLVEKLDGLFLKDENQRIYVALKFFEKYQRPLSLSIDEYINYFDLLHNKIKAHNINLPDAVIAYRLLESANLDSAKSELVRSTISTLSYKDMKAQLRKLEDLAIKKAECSSDLAIKEETEDTFYNNSRGGCSRGQWHRGYKGGYRGGYRGSAVGNDNKADKNNDDFKSYYRGPRRGQVFGKGGNRGGRRGACYVCQSVYHWANECPDKDRSELYKDNDNSQSQKQNAEEVEIVEIEI